MHDRCGESRCECQKHLAISPIPYQLKGSGLKNKIHEYFKRFKKAWYTHLRPALVARALLIGMTVGAKTKNHKVAPPTTNNSKTLSVGKF